MDILLDELTKWIKEMLINGIISNLSGLFDSVNRRYFCTGGTNSTRLEFRYI